MKSYKDIFKNDFEPHLEIMNFHWNFEKNEEKTTEFTQNLQNSCKNDTKNEEIQENEIIPENEVTFEIKDITPKKHLWRK